MRPRSEERIVGPQNLDHAACPANALADMRGEALGGEAGGLRNVDVGGVPAAHLHAQRGVRIFGDGFLGDAADVVERGAAQDRAGAAEERGVPEVVAVLNDAVEELAFVGNDVELAEIALKGIGRIEVMRAFAARPVCDRAGTSRRSSAESCAWGRGRSRRRPRAARTWFRARC